MTQLYTFLGDELINALGWTFVHSLWQGSLIALIMTAIMSRIPAQYAQRRYLIATSSLVLVLISSVITFALLYQQPQETVLIQDIAITGMPVPVETTSTSLYSWISQFNPFLVSIWIMGVIFFGLRFCFGLLYLRHLRNSATDLPEHWQDSLDRIAKTIGLPRGVKLAESALLKIPVVTGYLKPIILFPVGIINQLQVEEVEAILAHEVAHLLRNDFIQNLIQSLIEMIFYYHPAVWWISAVVRSERENCCDDLAIQVCSNSLTYAKALVRLEDISAHAPALALPFAGSKGHLLNRIKRILNQPQNKSNVMERIIATAILIGCVTLLSFSERHYQSQTEEPEIEIIRQDFYGSTDSIPQQREVTIWKTVDGKELEMRSSNGEVQSLKIDGEVIDPSEYEAYQDEIEQLNKIAEAPPVPPVPPMSPMSPLAPMPPMPPMPPLPPMPAMPAMPPMPPMPPMEGFQDGFFKSAFTMPAPGSYYESGSNKTTIIREKTGNGYRYHVDGDGNTDVMIDNDKGVAIVNGQEIELDADSVFVYVETEVHTPSPYVRTSQPFFGKEGRNVHGTPGVRVYGLDDNAVIMGRPLNDSIPIYYYHNGKLTEAQKAEINAHEDQMKVYGLQMEQFNKGLEGINWENYNKEMEVWGKQFENQDWKAYEEQMKEYGEQWKSQEGEWKVYSDAMRDHAIAEKIAIEMQPMNDYMVPAEVELERALILQSQGDGNFMVARAARDSKPFNSITSSMEREGLIDADREYNIILEADKLRVNGKRMSEDVHQRYLKLFERSQGYRLEGKSKIEISN